MSLDRDPLPPNLGSSRADRLIDELEQLAVMGHWELDLLDDLITWSPQFSRMLGYEPETLHPTLDVFLHHLHPDDHSRILAEIDSHRRYPRHFDVEFRLTRLDGETILVRSRGRTHADASGRGALMIGVNQDITEARRVEAELLAAKEAAEAASQAKSLFLATMSHELRTPLNAIIGYAEILEEEAQERNLPTFVDDLAKIHAAGRLLLGQISDVLDLARLDAGEMDLTREPVDVEAVVDEVAAWAAPRLEKNGNAWRLDVAGAWPEMSGDALKLAQCLKHLTCNAAKFTKDGTVTLRVAQEGDTAVFAVTDTGIGLSPEQQVALFESFVQVESGTTRRFGGTGLGLALTRRLVVMMGGSVAVDSRPGQGATFTLRLPAHAPRSHTQ